MKYWFVYICQGNNSKYYVGMTTDPIRRLQEHNSGRASKFGRDYYPLKLVWISHSFKDRSTARYREIQIKGWTRRKKEKLISGEWR